MENEYIKNLCKVFENMTPEEAAANDAEIERREKIQKAAEKIENYKTSGVPARYINESLDTFSINNDWQAKAAGAAIKFIKDVKIGNFKTLILLGSAGTGKTHLAAAICRELGGRFKTAPDLVEELRRLKSFTSNQTEIDLITYYGKLSLLIIDEIGRGYAATDEKYTLFQILNARYNTRKSTVLISNFKKSEFLNYIGVAAADRLVESADIYEINGESYRKELRAQNG